MHRVFLCSFTKESSIYLTKGQKANTIKKLMRRLLAAYAAGGEIL